MPSFPTNFNDTDALVDFAKDTGIKVGLGFLVPAIVLSVALIFIFVKYCGGSGKTVREFSGRARFVLIAVSGAVFVISVATCVVAWTYNNRIHSGIKDGSSTLQGVIITSNQLMVNVDDTVSGLTNQLLDEINSATQPVIANITGLFIPLNGILGVVGNVEGTLQNLASLTSQIVQNITEVNEDIDNLNNYEQMNIISDVPSRNDIPDVNSQYVESLNSSIDSLQGVVGNVKNMTNDVNDTLSEVQNQVTANLVSLADDYNNKANDVLSYLVDFQNQIRDTNKTYNDVSDDVINYSNIRKIVVAAILVLPLTLSGIGLAGAIFRIKPVLRLSAAFCFVFMFWYFLIAGVNYLAFYTLDEVCKNQDELVGNALSIANNRIVIPEANVSIVVSEKINLLLKCSGNNTLINIFEFNFLVTDLTNQIESEVNSLVNQTNQLNQTTNYQKGIDSLQQMTNSSVNLNFLQNASLPTVHEQLNNISRNLNETIYGEKYYQSLDAVNDITNNNLALNNGTTINVYYDETNITTLNCTVDPYDKIPSQSLQNDLCAKAAVAIELTIIRNEAILYQNDIYSNVTDIEERLDGFENALPTLVNYQNQTANYSTQIRGYLDDAFYRSTAIMGQVKDAAQIILILISSTTNSLVDDTQCAFLGDAYSSLSKNICTDISDSLEVIAAMMTVGAVMLFISAVSSIYIAYKIERDFIKK